MLGWHCRGEVLQMLLKHCKLFGKWSDTSFPIHCQHVSACQYPTCTTAFNGDVSSISFPTPNNDNFCHSKSITFRVNEEQSSVGVPTMTLKLTMSTRGDNAPPFTHLGMFLFCSHRTIDSHIWVIRTILLGSILSPLHLPLNLAKPKPAFNQSFF